MKNHPARSSQAFTLIELITVIAIISILMALLLPQIGAARDNARRQEAGTILRNAVNACNSYKQDYGKFPPVAGAGTGPTISFGESSAGCQLNNNVLFDILRAIPRGDNANNALNTRQQKYIENKKATDPKNPRDGFADGTEFSSRVGQLLDPWGAQYCIVLDNDGDEVIDMGAFYSDLAGAENAVRFSAVGFSLGKDSVRGGKGYEGRYKKPSSAEAPDDVVSWQ